MSAALFRSRIALLAAGALTSCATQPPPVQSKGPFAPEEAPPPTEKPERQVFLPDLGMIVPELGAPPQTREVVAARMGLSLDPAPGAVGGAYRVRGRLYRPKAEKTYDKTGFASFYGRKFHGRLTANGERFDADGMTAAHKTLPFGATVKVTRVDTGASVIVRINDRGPFVTNREIDLSRGAAAKLDMFDHGLVEVRVELLGYAPAI